MDAEPVLEIANDNVKCSHGVTLGQISEEELFYLQSRGVSRQQATSLIVQGFFDTILQSMGEHGDRIRCDTFAHLQGRMQELEPLDVAKLRAEFPILQQQFGGKPLVYLDTAASAQKPREVLEAMRQFYEQSYANVHRGIYSLAEQATASYEEARETMAQFINAQPEEVIFTRGTTDGLNMIARAITQTLQEGDEILVSGMEHHSNFVPWQQLAMQHKLALKIIELTPDDTLDLEDMARKITSRTRVIAVMHVSNVLGTINPIRQIAQLAHQQGALLIVDGAQAVAHMPVDVKDLDADIYAFSSHKMYGPEGVGVLYGKRELLEKLPPATWGGEMVKQVTVEQTSWNDLPYKFEPGTPPITQAVGMAKAASFLQGIGMRRIERYEQELTEYTIQRLLQLPNLQVIGPRHTRTGAISFSLLGIHAHDVAQILDSEGIAVRAGNHCTQPLHCSKGIDATVRISLGVYNTRDDIDKTIAALRKVQEIFA
jgi:cysteine desulfurase / selenocysteine lyase